MEPRCGKDFEYRETFETLRVTNCGKLGTHRGSFMVSSTLANELLAIDWYALNRGRLLFGTLCLGEVAAKVQHRRVRFFPVEVIDLNEPIANKGEELPELSPMSLDSVPLSTSTVTHVPG